MSINATLTVSTYNQTLRLNNNGAPNFIYGSFATSGRTLSDIILLARVPSGVTVCDWYLRGTSGETIATAKLGIKGGGTETSFGTLTFSTGAVCLHRAPGLIAAVKPIRVSASDTDAQAGVDIYMTVSAGTWTTSTSFDFGFWYFRDGNVNNG